MLLEADVARSLQNLRVDLANGLKFEIKWKDAYYINSGTAVDWVHGSASFEICSDDYANIMSKFDSSLHY